MHHPEIMRLLADDHIERLRQDAARHVRTIKRTPAVDTREVELRLCRVSDDPELERLAELDGHPLPAGRLVLAVVRGRIVAALPLGGDRKALTDPFTRTAHILPLLELRAAQLRDPEPRRRLLPRYAGLVRGSSNA